jgi:branched-chain amino acid transport system substrate-binding protein
MKKNTIFFLLVYLIFLFCKEGKKEENTLVLTIPLPLTGSQSSFGEIEKEAYLIAMEEINAKGGIKGKKISLSFEDSQGKPEISRAIVEKLIDTNKQPVLFGEYSSSCSKAIASVAEEKKVPYLVVTGAADDITTQNYQYVFRLNPPTKLYSTGLISFLKEVVKPKTMVILYESSDFGVSGAKAIKEDIKDLGIKILAEEKYEKGSPDFKPILTKIKSLNPDIIYMVSYVMDASLIMKQIKELRINANLYAGGAAGFAIPEFIENAGDAAEYVVTATLWSPEVSYPGTKEFTQKYKEKTGKIPSYHAAEAYSALYVIADALNRAKDLTSESIREALSQTEMMTVFGPVKFENKLGFQNQNFIDTLVLQVIQGKHETIWPQKFASKPYVYPIPKWENRK